MNSSDRVCGSLIFSLGILVVALGVFTTISDSFATPITLQGSNTLRLEYYDNAGNPAGSPFAFEGGQGYNEFNLNTRQQLSPYRNWQAQLSGVANASEYRAAQRNALLIERWNVKGECGDCGLPLRVEAGDYQAFFSLGTLQRSLKGVQIETQPDLGGSQRYSLQLIAGANTPDWRDPDFNDDRTLGASWLVTDDKLGSLSFNFSRNSRNTDGDLIQRTIGVAARTQWAMLKRKWTLENELNHFSGDHSNNVNGLNKQDTGVFFQLSGKQKKSKGNYRFRFERYGENYRPNGAVVSSNRRSIEAHSSWRFDSGLRARGRLQHFRNALESNNSSDTRTIGARLSGNLLGKQFKRVNGSLSGFVQLNDNKNDTVDRRTNVFNSNLNFPLSRDWTGTTSLAYTDTDDRKGAGDSDSINLRLGATRKINWSDFKGQVSPSVNLRKATRTSTSKDTNLALAASLSKGNHSLSMNTSFNQNRPGVAANANIANLAVNYRFRKGKSTFGAEFTENYRDLDGAEASKGMQVAVFWTYNFDKTFRAKPSQRSDAITLAPAGELDILNFSPNQLLVDIPAMQQLSYSQLGNFLMSETTVFSDSDQRQRLVIREQADEVDFSAVIIDFDDTGSLDSAAQIFERTKRMLVNRYGVPDTFLERGEFDEDLAARVNNDSFIRTMEWQAQEGILRFGIPRRLDGVIRMELQYAKRFNAATDTFWSVEEIQ